MDSSDPIRSVGQAAPGRNAFLEQLSSRVADLTVGELCSMTLSGVCVGERQAFLESHSPDMVNGFHPRNVNIGGVPTRVADPRTCTGDSGRLSGRGPGDA